MGRSCWPASRPPAPPPVSGCRACCAPPHPAAHRKGAAGRGGTLDQLDAELLTLAIPPESRLHGVALFELRLPTPTVVSLIIRNGETLVPQRETRLLAGDELLIVTTSRTREATERRLRAVSRRGRLAHWFGEHGDPEPT